MQLTSTWPVLARQLHECLEREGHAELAAQVPSLEVHGRCDCGDSFCQSFSTALRPDGPWGPGLVNVEVTPPWPGMLVLDVVDGQIRHVEVIDRGSLD